MKGGITKLRDDVTARLNEKISRVHNMQGFLNRVIYQEYRRLQLDRWDSENRSEGKQWKGLNKFYLENKLKRFAKYPYAGARIGVASGRLIKGTVGPSPEHRKIAKRNSLVVSTTVPYAEYFDEKRTIRKWSRRTMNRLRDLVKEYVRHK